MAKVGLENDTLKQPKCPSNWEYSTGQRQLLDIQSGEQMDRLSFSALAHSDNRKIIAFFCAFRGRVRDHIDNPSKPPFKFTSLLFVATARKNKFICSSLALIATLIREASLGAEKEIRHERPQDSPFRGWGCKYSSRYRHSHLNTPRCIIFDG